MTKGKRLPVTSFNRDGLTDVGHEAQVPYLVVDRTGIVEGTGLTMGTDTHFILHLFTITCPSVFLILSITIIMAAEAYPCM